MFSHQLLISPTIVRSIKKKRLSLVTWIQTVYAGLVDTFQPMNTKDYNQ